MNNLPKFKYYNLLWVFLGGVLFIVISLHDYRKEEPIPEQIGKQYGKNEVKDGRVETFDSFGVLRTVVNYKEGIKHGLAEKFDRKGTIQLQMPYVDGDRHGTSVKFYEDGSKYAETPYNDDFLTGVRKTYYRNGQLRSELSYFMSNPGTDLVEYTKSGSKKEYEKSFDLDRAGNVILIEPQADCMKSQVYTGYLINNSYFTEDHNVVSVLSSTSDGRFTITKNEYDRLKAQKGAKLICKCTTRQGNKLIYHESLGK